MFFHDAKVVIGPFLDWKLVVRILWHREWRNVFERYIYFYFGRGFEGSVTSILLSSSPSNVAGLLSLDDFFMYC